MKKCLVLMLMLMLMSKFAWSVPTYSEVISFYFKHYEASYSGYIEFSKRKTGWYADLKEFTNTSPGKVLQSTLLWSKQKDSWIMNAHPPAKTISDQDMQQSIRNFKKHSNYSTDSIFYTLHDFYGYSGWDWDVIQYLELQPNKSADKLESLARAYSNYAIGFFHNQYGHFFENNNPYRRILSFDEAIEANRADSFIRYSKKAICYFEEIVDLDSNYNTLLGKISNKVNNEKMFAYHTLDIMGFEEKGATFLDSVRFSDSLLQIAEGRLKGHPSKAVIFTLGDLDYLPIIYLKQKNQGKYPIVLNYSLMQSARYIKYVKRKFRELAITIADSLYTAQEYFPVSRSGNPDQAMAWPDWVQHLKPLQYSRQNLMSFPSDKLLLRINGKDQVIKLDQYLYRCDLLLLDILSNNENYRAYLTGDFGLIADWLKPARQSDLLELKR